MISSPKRNVAAVWLLLAFLPFVGCVSDTRGIQVDIAYLASDVAQPFNTDLGYSIELQQATIAFYAVRIEPCGSDSAIVVDGLAWLLGKPSVAKAHTNTTPTQLGVPYVFDVLVANGQPVIGGTILPPPNEYCALTVLFSPPDSDARGNASDTDGFKDSVRIQGTATAGGQSQGRAFEIAFANSMQASVSYGAALSLLHADDAAKLTVTLDVSRWFDGVDFDNDDVEQIEARVRSNIEANVAAVLQIN